MAKEIADYYEAIHPTGSRYSCCPAPTDTDQDFIVLVKKQGYFSDLPYLLAKEGFELGGSQVVPVEDTHPHNMEGFMSWKKGELNLIITCSSEFYDKFVRATLIAKACNLRNKEDRVRLFQKILYNTDNNVFT